jgi:putative sporulation protein YyaC
MATLEENTLCKRLDFDLGELDIEVVTKFILEQYNKSNKDGIIIVNIGTDRIIGDMFAPMLGSLMEEKMIDIKFYGTLEDPIHALNIDSKLENIFNIHRNPFIIGIDACVGSSTNTFIIRNKPIQAGKGLDKDLPSVGDVSIAFVIGNDVFNRDIRSGMIYKAVKEANSLIESIDNQLGKNIKIVL